MLPDLTEYRHHRAVRDAPFEGRPVPGLHAEYFRRAEGGRTATVGRYSWAGRELLMAWGYTDEEHCRHHAVRAAGGGWHPAADGCPEVRVMRDGQAVVGLAVRASNGDWVTDHRPPRPGPPGA